MTAPRVISRFRGATVLVTGAGSGIGRSLGTELTRAGARVVFSDVDGEAAEAAATAASADAEANGSASARTLDVRDAEAFRAVVDEIVAREGRLDALFNNAGMAMGGPTHELTKAHWDRIIDVNLRGVVNGLLAAYPLMVAAGSGLIVNTASGVGLAAPPFVTAYAATKHAVVGLSTGLRPEAALHGVQVTVFCPGAVETPILDRAPDGDLPPTPSAAVTAREYLKLMRQRPVDAGVVARKALERIAAGKAIVVVPSSTKGLWYLQRISPGLVQRMLVPAARRVERTLIRQRDG